MAEEKDVFYVVKKGDVVGIYNSFNDIQPLLASSSVSGDSISIHKGYALPKKSEEYLISNGLKGASYSINASDVKEGLFGRLLTCPYQHPPSTGGRALDVISSSVKLQEAVPNSVAQSSPLSLNLRPVIVDVPRSEPSTSVARSSLFSTNYPRPLIRNVPRLDPSTCKAAGSSLFSSNTPRPVTTYHSQPEPSTCLSCTLHFDGASKGNPGPAGAGSVLRADDGSKVYRLREGVGVQTNNVAEYRGLILGLKQALKNGYKHIRVQGDSLLVCNQVQGKWKIKNQNMGILCNEAKELKNKFLSFQINHVLREFNSEADAQANLAVNLRDGQVEEDCAPH
ncbi:putative ribonuclease H [Lupinus albus]|uniref:Putative ribonuclease H n=1 Tax=Lupinus albus TaxID=3870 RepID=A0A6A4R1Q3_LUPAL|nr:putative ribonuclease H [Lupinus albus]